MRSKKLQQRYVNYLLAQGCVEVQSPLRGYRKLRSKICVARPRFYYVGVHGAVLFGPTQTASRSITESMFRNLVKWEKSLEEQAS